MAANSHKSMAIDFCKTFTKLVRYLEQTSENSMMFVGGKQVASSSSPCSSGRAQGLSWPAFARLSRRCNLIISKGQLHST